MDEMEEVEELFQVAEEVMQEQDEGGRVGGAGANTSRRRMRTNRLRPTATGSTPVVGQEVFVKVHGTFHKAVVKKILPLTDPTMYMCVHSSTSRYSGQVQAALEADIIPACDTYKSFKRSRDGLKQFAQDLSQSSHAARSAASKLRAETKKGLKAMRAAEDERVVLAWKAYCRGDDGTRTWSAREQEKPIAALPHVADPLGP
jgi:hypothetical protein